MELAHGSGIPKGHINKIVSRNHESKDRLLDQKIEGSGTNYVNFLKKILLDGYYPNMAIYYRITL